MYLTLQDYEKAEEYANDQELTINNASHKMDVGLAKCLRNQGNILLANSKTASDRRTELLIEAARKFFDEEKLWREIGEEEEAEVAGSSAVRVSLSRILRENSTPAEVP